jgi:hypothetical protein
MYELDVDVVHEAERAILRAQWHLLEESALHRAAGRRGLVRTPLYPVSRVIQLVTVDGRYVGRIRLANPGARHQRWMATPPGGRPLGPFHSARAAANALGRARSDR